eukprot:11195450-Lingulodinium_polyedra.AAC.1
MDGWMDGCMSKSAWPAVPMCGASVLLPHLTGLTSREPARAPPVSSSRAGGTSSPPLPPQVAAIAMGQPG